jgi:glycosyltransferase involved in cell wall biosynthesis
VGGALPGEDALYESIRRNAALRPNLTFHGRRSYWDVNTMYARARLLINTSEVEGFPNAYLQAWIRGVPVVSYIDPDGVIARNGLGAVVESAAQMRDAILRLLGDPSALADASSRCRAFMAREFAEERILTPYLTAFEELTRHSMHSARPLATSDQRHV